MKDGYEATLAGTLESFVSLIKDLSEVYLVFDALDECPKEGRGEVLGFINDVLSQKDISCHVKIFVTSRRENDIAEAFRQHNRPTIYIQAERVAADIKTYVRSQVEIFREGKNGRRLYIDSDELKENIVQTLTEKAEGM